MLAIFSNNECFLKKMFLFTALLTAEVDASNDEAAGSGKGMKGRGRSIFALLEECGRKNGGGLQ